MNNQPSSNTEAEELYRLYAGKELSPVEKMKIPAQEMPNQDPKVRSRNMKEVALGYTKEQAVVEATRCLQCKNPPCISDCPVHINIPAFLAETAKENFDEALKVIRRDSLLPAMCGRVCPQESQCQKNCTMGKGRLNRTGRTLSGRQCRSGTGSNCRRNGEKSSDRRFGTGRNYLRCRLSESRTPRGHLRGL